MRIPGDKEGIGSKGRKKKDKEDPRRQVRDRIKGKKEER